MRAGASDEAAESLMERLIAGPFVLAKESGKLPPGILTVSECLADIAPDLWTIEWAKVDDRERAARAAEFGMDGVRLEEAIRWATDHLNGGGLAWPNVFLVLAAAREFHQRFVSVSVRLLQFSLPEPMLERFLALTTPPAPEAGYAPIGSIGAHDALARRTLLTDEGEPRGYEVLGYDGASGFDSFRCNALDADFQRLLGVSFNRWGLIDDASHADRCAQFADSPDASTCAIAWHPWLITEHAL